MRVVKVSVILTRLEVGTDQFKYLYGRGCLNGLKVINCAHWGKFTRRHKYEDAEKLKWE